MDARLCPNCGKMIEPTDSFCPWCSYNLMRSRKEAESLKTGGKQLFPSWGNDAQETGWTVSGEDQSDPMHLEKDFGDFGSTTSAFPTYVSPTPQQPFREQTSYKQTIHQPQSESAVKDPDSNQKSTPDDDVYKPSRTVDQDTWNNWMYTNIQWMDQISRASNGTKKPFPLLGFLS